MGYTIKRVPVYIVVLILTTCFCNAPAAKNRLFYVSPYGNNTHSGSTKSKAWQTLSFALCGGVYGCPEKKKNDFLISKGDTLFLEGGTYKEHNIEISSNGTADSPIVITNIPGERPVIDGEYKGVVFNLDGTHHVIIDGLKIIRGKKAGIMIGEDRATSHITIKNCIIDDIKIDDNTAGIFLNPSYDAVTITKNRISVGHREKKRGAAIELFMGGNNVIIDSNELFNSYCGVYYKHGVNDGPHSPRIQNNYVHDVTFGIDLSTDGGIISNNYLENAGIRIFPTVSAYCDRMGAFNTHISSNTLISGSILLGWSPECPDRGARNTVVTNNLIIAPLHEQAMIIWPYYKKNKKENHITQAHSNLYYCSGSDAFRVYGKMYSFNQYQQITQLEKNSLCKVITSAEIGTIKTLIAQGKTPRTTSFTVGARDLFFNPEKSAAKQKN